VELHETIQLPDYSEAAYLPEADKIDGSAASFNGGYSLQNNQLVLDETIAFKKRKYQAREWENYRNVIKIQKKLAREKIILKK